MRWPGAWKRAKPGRVKVHAVTLGGAYYSRLLAHVIDEAVL
jgi:hypothetical protein